MDQSASSTRPTGRRYTDEFRRDAVRLITDEQYSFKAAADLLDVSSRSLREWHRKFAPPPTPCGENATADELREEIKRLRKELKQADLEREILKKATVYFAKESQ